MPGLNPNPNGLLFQQQRPRTPPNSFGLDPSSNSFASDALAQLTRANWLNYISRFRDKEDLLIAYATDPNKAREAATMAGTNVDEAFGRVQGGLDRTLQRQGVTMSPEQSAALARTRNTQQDLARIGAKNQASRAVHDLQSSIMSGGQTLGSITGGLETKLAGLQV